MKKIILLGVSLAFLAACATSGSTTAAPSVNDVYNQATAARDNIVAAKEAAKADASAKSADAASTSDAIKKAAKDAVSGATEKINNEIEAWKAVAK